MDRFFIMLTQTFLLLFLLVMPEPLCREDEKYALLQFKNSFLVDKYASSDSSAYPKTASWNDSECCEWDGVECDNSTGHVVGLDVSSSHLCGFINSSSSIFLLVHLKRLNLADNFFNYSQIPSEIRYLQSLTYLDLSRAAFDGQVPSEIARLTKLTFLDLSHSSLELKRPNFERLAQNLSRLEVLRLSSVYISTSVPNSLANLSSLRTLVLENCELQGTFPSRIFQLPNLQLLSLNHNNNLTGQLPEFHGNSVLQVLRLASTNLNGKLPTSIGTLQSLAELQVPNSCFSGLIPSSIGNLTKLTYLDLAYNSFTGEIPFPFANLRELTVLSLAGNNFSFGNFPWLGKLSSLFFLDIGRSNLVGEIPSAMRNLTHLHILDMKENRLTGQIPFWFSNLTSLNRIFLNKNNLYGPIPKSISQLVNLEVLHLQSNFLNGTLKFDMFLGLKNLVYLHLSWNHLSLLTNISGNASIPKYKLLGLRECNLKEFPDFLQFQDQLRDIQLHGNNIHGQIPEWIWKVWRNSLWSLGLGYNSLTGSIESSKVSQLVNLKVLDIRSNKFQGALPVPSSSVRAYRVSNNSLSGDIPESLCKLQHLEILELDDNNLTGTLPQCLGNLSNNLYVLNMQNNALHGRFPDTFKEGCALKMIDVSQNQLLGPLPRSLANCTNLRSLDFSDNRFTDAFPSWLGSLPGLEVLDLRSNKFCGMIGHPETDSDFPVLRIIDLSSNGFMGDLPSGYFKIWNSMKFFEVDKLDYMRIRLDFSFENYVSPAWIMYSMVLTKAGIEMTYTILETVAVIDLSSNKFSGEIPESIGNLQMLWMLNLSNNHLTGRIPSALKNITKLESLDLSFNNLSGEIPPELKQLTFLAFFNVSYNHLLGPIPQGNQFNTFLNTSYEGNMGLCGKPVSDACGAPYHLPPQHSSTEEDGDASISWVEMEWIMASAGYVSGFFVGVVIGRIFTGKKHEWFMDTFGRRQPRRRRQRRQQ